MHRQSSESTLKYDFWENKLSLQYIVLRKMEIFSIYKFITQSINNLKPTLLEGRRGKFLTLSVSRTVKHSSPDFKPFDITTLLFRPELKGGVSMVRELHVYGSVVPVAAR